MSLLHRFRQSSLGIRILWGYLIWYLVLVGCYFDPSPRLWLNALAMSGLIGLALFLAAGIWPLDRQQLLSWKGVRFFAMPFCVSSFAAIGRQSGFWFVLAPDWGPNLLALGALALFLLLNLSLQPRPLPT